MSLSPQLPVSAIYSPSLSGYLARASPSPVPDFSPPRSALRLAALRNGPVEQDGFTLALFDNHVAVDSTGRVLVLTPPDYDGLLSLATAVGALPPTGDFRNQWRIAQRRTGYPIDRILTARTTLSDEPAEKYQDEYVETSVYGFDGVARDLKTPVDVYTHLPDPLWELTSLLLEARTNVPSDGERNEAVLDRVRRLLGNVF